MSDPFRAQARQLLGDMKLPLAHRGIEKIYCTHSFACLFCNTTLEKATKATPTQAEEQPASQPSHSRHARQNLRKRDFTVRKNYHA